MREFAGPTTLALPSHGNLTDDVVHNGTHRGDSVAFGVRDVDGWHDVTAAEFLARVRAVARGLVAAGLRPGDRVGLLSRTRFEWTLLDYAIWFAGAVSVPIYETSSAEQLGWILHDSGATALVVETVRHLDRLQQASEDGGRDGPAHVWCLEDDAIGRLTALGSHVTEDELEARRTAAGPGSLATILYTSGTTGRPRGCMLTHGNFMVETEVAVAELEELFADDEAATLLVLPLAHVFARVVQVGAVRARVKLGHTSDVRHLGADLRQFRPTFLLAVPRVFEKVFTTASQEAAADGRGAVFNRAAAAAIAWSRALDRGTPGPLLRVRHAFYERLVYERLRQLWGGRCRYAVSGGAPLGERLGHFYRGIGLTVLEGYGLTETTAAVTVNVPDAVKIGTVGRPLAGTSVRVSDEGELQVRGGQVLAGYWRDEAGTAEALARDGWLRAGGLGEIDDEGFVHVTGRRKEILVTTGGKNVAPAALEERLRAHPLVSQCMVVGDGRPYIAALVTVDPDALATWLERRGRRGRLPDLVDDPELRAELQTAVDTANTSVSQAEAIRRFVVLTTDWTEEDGQLTPSLKVKRNVVLAQFRRQVADLYER